MGKEKETVKEEVKESKYAKYFKRKFLLPIVGVIIGVLVTMGKLAPENSEKWIEVIVGSLVVLGSILGFVHNEYKMDMKNKEK